MSDLERIEEHRERVAGLEYEEYHAHMKIPMHQECECGHRGSRHREDGTCARCECERFTHPVHLYSRGDAPGVARKSVGARPVR